MQRFEWKYKGHFICTIHLASPRDIWKVVAETDFGKAIAAKVADDHVITFSMPEGWGCPSGQLATFPPSGALSLILGLLGRERYLRYVNFAAGVVSSVSHHLTQILSSRRPMRFSYVPPPSQHDGELSDFSQLPSTRHYRIPCADGVLRVGTQWSQCPELNKERESSSSHQRLGRPYLSSSDLLMLLGHWEDVLCYHTLVLGGEVKWDSQRGWQSQSLVRWAL